MKQATVLLPPEIGTNCPREYVAALNNPAIADITPAQAGQRVVVGCDERMLSWASGDWSLRISRPAFLGAWVGRGSFGDREFITFVLAFGGGELGGPVMLSGQFSSAAWFKELAASLAPIIPGGVQWKIS